jgi:hypothetical protein
MRYVIPRFIIMNGEVIIPNEDFLKFQCLECPSCGYIKLSGSVERI